MAGAGIHCTHNTPHYTMGMGMMGMMGTSLPVDFGYACWFGYKCEWEFVCVWGCGARVLENQWHLPCAV